MRFTLRVDCRDILAIHGKTAGQHCRNLLETTAVLHRPDMPAATSVLSLQSNHAAAFESLTTDACLTTANLKDRDVVPWE